MGPHTEWLGQWNDGVWLKRTYRLACGNVSICSAAPQKEIDMAGLTTIGLIAAAIVPEIAEAAAPGVSPSLKNLLLSVAAGGVVAAAIGIAVAGVSTFDPVKRR
jgi:hypothetical protein